RGQVPRWLPGSFDILPGYLFVQRPVVIQYAQQEQATSEEVDDRGDPYAHVQAMGTEDYQKGQQNPAQIEIDPSRSEALIRSGVHRWNQKQIHDPADEEQPQGEKIQGARPGFAVVETVCPHKTENPQQIAYGFA